jgi:hypothetical protein
VEGESSGKNIISEFSELMVSDILILSKITHIRLSMFGDLGPFLLRPLFVCHIVTRDLLSNCPLTVLSYCGRGKQFRCYLGIWLR